MYESIWRLERRPLDREDRVDPIFGLLGEFPGFEPAEYDLNQKEQWRPFDRRRTVVDALTQRTQLVRIRSADGSAVAMVAMGKHGEQPTVVVRLPDSVELDAVVDFWDHPVADLDPESLLVTAETLRDEMEEAGLYWEDASISRALVYGWSSRRRPAWLDELAAREVVDETPVSVESRDRYDVLWLAPDGRIEDDRHVESLGAVGRLAS